MSFRIYYFSIWLIPLFKKWHLGAKKADLVALLETQVEGGASSTVGDAPPAAEPEDSNDVADEIEKISAEDDLAADLAADDDDKVGFDINYKLCTAFLIKKPLQYNFEL